MFFPVFFYVFLWSFGGLVVFFLGSQLRGCRDFEFLSRTFGWSFRDFKLKSGTGRRSVHFFEFICFDSGL